MSRSRSIFPAIALLLAIALAALVWLSFLEPPEETKSAARQDQPDKRLVPEPVKSRLEANLPDVALPRNAPAESLAPIKPDEAVDAKPPKLAEIPRPTEGARPIANELILRISNPENRALLEALIEKYGLKIEGELARLGMVRISWDGDLTPEALAELRRIADDIAFNYPINHPAPIPLVPELDPETGEVERRASGGMSPFYGLENAFIRANNGSRPREPVKVAVIDTPLQNALWLNNGNVQQLNLIKASGLEPHGQSVSSIIAGKSADFTAFASNQTDLLHIGVLDDSGQSDSFSLAEAIFAAADANAQIINLSLGGHGDNPVLREAIRYAQAKGSLIVAAAGNDATNQPVFPAAYDGVIGVAAVDAVGDIATFSNFGSHVDIAAPGVGLKTLGANGQSIPFTGTSAAAPIVTASLVSIIAENPGITNEEALSKLLTFSNDAGLPGHDDEFGAGILNLQRVREAGQPNIQDLAIADFVSSTLKQDRNGSYYDVTVAVQNRGTVATQPSRILLETPGSEGNSQIVQGLNPNETTSLQIRVPITGTHEGIPFAVLRGRLQQSAPEKDVRPENDALEAVFAEPPPAP